MGSAPAWDRGTKPDEVAVGVGVTALVQTPVGVRRRAALGGGRMRTAVRGDGEQIPYTDHHKWPVKDVIADDSRESIYTREDEAL